MRKQQRLLLATLLGQVFTLVEAGSTLYSRNSLLPKLQDEVSLAKAVVTSNIFLIGLGCYCGARFGIRMAEAYELKNANTAGPQMNKFVSETLSRAGYQLNDIVKYKVILNSNRFRNIPNGIKVFLSDEQLQQAMKYYTEGRGLTILDHVEYQILKERFSGAPDKDIHLLMAYDGKALTPDTIPLLKWHILTQLELQKSKIWDYLILSPIMVALYAGEYINIKKGEKLTKIGNEKKSVSFNYFHENGHVTGNIKLTIIEKLPAWIPFSIAFISEVAWFIKNLWKEQREIVRQCYNTQPEVIFAYINCLRAIGRLEQYRIGWNKKINIIFNWFLPDIQKNISFLITEYKHCKELS